ncbi:MAG TPA: hypothetical protein VFI41_04790 [Gemmatimonadales bacterium]|nr:hypothetical protein [Gemmatimonadales bacterium]
MNLSEYAEQIHKTAVDHGWWENGDRNIGEVMMLIVTEVAEAFEHYRHGQDITEVFYLDDKREGVKDKPDGVPIELADILIRVLDFAHYNGIDIERAMQIKMAYNDSRPYKHGGKKC